MEQWEIDRADRGKKMAKLWEKFTQREGFREVYLICGRSTKLFKDALLSYENGAFLGSAVMCRGATEALIYATASLDTSKIKIDRNYTVWGDGIIYDYSESKYGDILEKSKETGFVRTSDECIINEIRHEGNFAAHFGKEFDKRILKYASTGKDPSLDISEEKGLEILEKTEDVISTIMKRIFEFVKSLPLPS